MSEAPAPDQPDVDIKEAIHRDNERFYDITREEFLDRFVEPADLEEANLTGLFEEFLTDEESGYDALIHIFSGELKGAKNRIAFGFHLESAAPNENTGRTKLPPLNELQASRLAIPRQFEPYNAVIKIMGQEKVAGWNYRVRHGNIVKPNTMFPAGYDVYSLSTILVLARDSRDRNNDVALDEGRPIINIGIKAKKFRVEIPLIDRKNTMEVQMVVEDGTEKIISAYPVLKPKSDPRLADYTADEINEFLVN